MNIQISKSTIDTLTSNLYDVESGLYLSKLPTHSKLLVLSQFLKDNRTTLSEWSACFTHDAKLMEDDFPELTSRYKLAAKELKSISKLYSKK
jgi:hypothetical protein|tara:strand:+ start:587 stop:862 length:276 start_codon:yes stop_codon:yes gene_type:complete